MGEALLGGLVPRGPVHFAEHVRVAVEDEPAVFADESERHHGLDGGPVLQPHGTREPTHDRAQTTCQVTMIRALPRIERVSDI